MHRTPAMVRNPVRRGSTFIVVLALLALLAIIGLAFVSFTSAEKESAEFYLSANSRPGQEDFDALDFGIRQLVLGATEDQYNSAMWGGRHSLVAGMLGKDLNPHSGQGIHLGINNEDINFNGQLDPGEDTNGNGLLDDNGAFFLDQNFDGNPDNSGTIGGTILQINDSPVARNGFLTAATRLLHFPDPDIGCSYPDINNVFLAWRDYPLDSVSNLPYLAVLPSFHRPGLLRNPNNSLPFPNWEVSPNTPGSILRPHPDHMHILENGLSSSYGRFVGDMFVATSLGLSGPFPFGNEDRNGNGGLDAGEDFNHNNRLDADGHHGVWTMTTGTPTRIGQWQRNGSTFARKESNGNVQSQPFAPRYEFDADPDGDGIKEAIWLDLDHPVRVLADGRMIIPMFAFTVLDADGKVNVNTAGNASNVKTPQNPAGLVDFDRNPSTPFGFTEDRNGNGTLDTNPDEDFTGDGLLDTRFISQSNQGLLPSEVNPQWVLNASPIHDTYHSESYGIHRQTFGYAPRDRGEASNMEWWFALKGGSDGQVQFPGRAGEAGISGSNGIPQPGYSGFDDNWNRGEGQLIATAIGIPFLPDSLAGYRAFRHPLDFRASGQSHYFGTDSTSPLDPGNNQVTWKWRPRMYASGARMERWNQYRGYQGPITGQNYVHWNTLFNGSGALVPFNDPLLDDEAETVVDRRFNQFSDAVYTGSESFLLQASNADLPIAELESRLVTLMPFNLKTSRRAQSIRRNLTTDSWDLKSFRRAQSLLRPWEFPNGRLANNLVTNNILRSEVFRLLDQTGEQLGRQVGTGPDATILIQSFASPISSPMLPHYETRAYRLSLNHLLTWFNENANSNQLVMRPLTPHPDPASLPSTPISTAVASFPPQNSTGQEFWARRDRQRMARDIYSLLYLFCGGKDGIDPSTTPNGSNSANPLRQIHDERRLREMAQFAVNLVDTMDRDSINTVFEYDKDLSDGWNLDDNALGLPANQEPISVRGIVTGIEVQQLTISEAFTVFAPMVLDSSLDRVDHEATDYDDRNPRGFGWFEIRNAGTEPVDLNTGAWKLQLMTLAGAGEDKNVNGVIDHGEDLNNNGVLDPGEDLDGDGDLDPSEDLPVNNFPDGNGILDLEYHTAVIPRSIGYENGVRQTILQPGRVLAIGTAADTNHLMVPDPANNNVPTAQDPRPAYLKVDIVGDGAYFTHYAPGNREPNTHYLDLITTPPAANFTLEFNGVPVPETIAGAPNPEFHGILLRGLAGHQPNTTQPWAVPDLENVGDPIFDTLATTYQAALRTALRDSSLYLLLKRRMYPGRPVPTPTTPAYEADNPWITVDRMLIPAELTGTTPANWTRELEILVGDSSSPTIKNKLPFLRSRERDQPLGRLDSDWSLKTTTNIRQTFCGIGTPASNLYDDDEDLNNNGVLDPGEDLNNNGILDPAVDRNNTIGNLIYDRSIPSDPSKNVPIENTTSYKPGSGIRRVSTTQRHLDRDLASPMELMLIPLYGPEEATRLLKDRSLRPQHQYEKFIESTGLTTPNGWPKGWFNPLPPTDATVAASRFLVPDHPSSLVQDNRWYRLLEFVEVKTRMDRFMSDSEDIDNNGQLDPGEDSNNNNVLDPYIPRNRRHRVAGRINLNTIRDPDVLAALLDEPHAFHRSHKPSGPHYLFDRSEPNRDWWIQFRLARDRIDPLTGFTLPGMPGSQPFRDLGFLSTGKDSIEHTLLRSLPIDASLPDDKRRLFGLGTQSQWTNNEDINRNHMWDLSPNNEDTNQNGQLDIPVELSVRQHLNSKIFNNSTVRSHVFHVFLKVEWFEAYQMPHPQDPTKFVTRIGAKVTDVPSQRGFYVIDRSRAIEQATHPLALPPSPEDTNQNGQLDPGEDQNNNGRLDRAFNFADAPHPIDVDPLIIYKAVIE